MTLTLRNCDSIVILGLCCNSDTGYNTPGLGVDLLYSLYPYKFRHCQREAEISIEETMRCRSAYAVFYITIVLSVRRFLLFKTITSFRSKINQIKKDNSCKVLILFTMNVEFLSQKCNNKVKT